MGESLREREESVVRNSGYRQYADFADGAVELIHAKSGGRVKAWHLTALGVGFSILGIELAERQSRKGKHTPATTALAFVSAFIGVALDVGDGNKARLERSKMTDAKTKERHEIIGNVADPFADGVIEDYQSGSAAFTAAEYGDAFSTKMALRRMRSVSFPRLAKAAVGCVGINVPETYRFLDFLHGDIRFFGTSLGRKIPNYLATLVNRVEGVPVQGILDVLATAANVIVTAERFSALITSWRKRGLSTQEIKQSRVRTVVLGFEALISWIIADNLERHLIGKIEKRQELRNKEN